MAVSQRTIQAIEEGGWIRHMFEIGIEMKSKHGEDNVFDLSLGNPIMEPPPNFNTEIAKLITSRSPGMHRYMPNAGYLQTRTAVAQLLKDETGIAFTPREIVMTCGAAGALNVIFETILNPRDEVIIFSPFFGEFTFYIENHQGRPVIAPTDDLFQPDLEALDRLITPRTRAVLINSPNNPSGALYSADKIIQLSELIHSKEQELGTEIFLISDEPYRRIIFDNVTYPHIFQYHHATIAVHSHSKDLAIPGERIGYIAINPNYAEKSLLADGLISWTRSLGFVNAPAMMQNTITSLQGVSINAAEYERKRNYLYSELTRLGYEIVKPQGAFYMFPKSPIDDDVDFVATLQKWNVLTVPGKGFGSPGFFRISYCVEDRVLEGAMDGFANAIQEHRS